MLGFFPSPYPDEILYSVIARYNTRSGNDSNNKTLMELFGNKSISTKVFFPSDLEYMCSQLPEQSQITVEELIYNHTIIPFFQPFLSQVRLDKIIAGMKGNTGRSTYTSSGIVQSAIFPPEYLRYCPKCVLSDREKYNEAYWHRSHQLSGIEKCHLHKITLMDSPIHTNPTFRSFRNQKKYHDLESILENIDFLDNSFSVFEDKHLEVLISQYANWFLTTSIQPLNADELKNKYRFYLFQKGYALVGGGIRIKQLAEDFSAFFGNDLLNKLKCEMNNNQWLGNLFHLYNHSCVHPIRHILMMIFLEFTPEQFIFNPIQDISPFGPGPWICLNRASTHYNKPVIQKCIITKEGGVNGKPVGHFHCSCGFMYSRRGPDTHEKDKYKIGLVQEYGDVWKNKLLLLREKERLTFTQIAKMLGVNAKTASKFYKKIINGEVRDKKKQSINSDSKCKYREKWLAVVKENEHLTKSQIIKLPGSGYGWLYKRDREWLIENSPSPLKRGNYGSRRNSVNWSSLDIVLKDKVFNAADEIKKMNGYPLKVTRSSIGKLIENSSALLFHLNKLPMTDKALRSVVESTKEYQIRRIKWAAKNLFDSEKLVSAYRISIAAAISPSKMTSDIKEIVNKLSSKYSLKQKRSSP